MAAIASAGSAWSFWKTVRNISPRSIEEEAGTSFKLALVGEAAERARLKSALLTDRATEAEREEAENFLREMDAAPDADAGSAYAFVLYATGPGDIIGARGANSVPLTGKPDELAEGILEMRPDLTVALARRFPLFRTPACNRLIRDTSKVNASIAILSALPGVLPISAIFLPGASVADTILLTKNQIMLVMRLAAAHGRKPSYTTQIKELIGTVGSALGWRTLARELVGLVPGGVGVALKGSIAYSGTFAVGKSALWFYQTGQVPSPPDIRKLYARSREEAAKEVEELRRKAQ